MGDFCRKGVKKGRGGGDGVKDVHIFVEQSTAADVAALDDQAAQRHRRLLRPVGAAVAAGRAAAQVARVLLDRAVARAHPLELLIDGVVNLDAVARVAVALLDVRRAVGVAVREEPGARARRRREQQGRDGCDDGGGQGKLHDCRLESVVVARSPEL